MPVHSQYQLEIQDGCSCASVTRVASQHSDQGREAVTILTLAMSKEEGGGGGGGQPPEQSHAQYVGPYRLEKTLGKGQTGRCWS